MKIRVIFLTCFCALSVAASAQKSVVSSDKIYFLSTVYSGSKKNTLCKDKGHIVFDSKSGSAACFTSCSFIQLKFSESRSAFKFSISEMPKEPCSDPLVNLEEDLKLAFPKVNRCVKQGKQIVFLNDSDTLMVFHEK